MCRRVRVRLRRGRRVHGGDYWGEHDVAFVSFFFRVNNVSGCTKRKISFLFSLSSSIRNKLLCQRKCYLIVRLESTQVDCYGLQLSRIQLGFEPVTNKSQG